MARRSCDGIGLLETFRAAVANLERHVDEINGLNVYPVPDGDTGSNMLATVRAALDEAERVADQSAEQVAAAISFGSLMGARGNSGVIASQVFRGMAEGLGGKRHFNGLDLARALSEGTTAAYAAVSKPVEGTILTVIRDASVAAVAAAERDNDIESVLRVAVDAAQESVAKTPTLLAILREAGVVDAGGEGLYRLFQGALLHMVGQTPVAAEKSSSKPKPSTIVGHEDEGFGYETMFLLRAEDSRLLDVDAIRRHLESIGESVLVAGDPRAVKVHVHNERPDLVIGYGLTLGSMNWISVENLDSQARDVRESRAAEFTGTSGAEPAPAAASASRSMDQVRPIQPLAVIAVAAGDGLAKIFLDGLGVAGVVRGGQSSNPSTSELLEAVERVEAEQVLLLPNNPNVVAAAQQVAGMSSRRVVVVPTRNAAEGIAALLALDPTKDAVTNAEAMTQRGRGLRTFAVTEAVRDATIGGGEVKRGQAIVLDPDDGLIAADSNPERAVLAAMRTIAPGTEIVSIYYGGDATLAETEALARKIGEALPGVETEIFDGGQPYYRFLIAAE